MRELHGYNEFSVDSPEPLYLKFAKTIYESPLILLLFGSAIVSAALGNVDDAVSITIAILIVLTGEHIFEFKLVCLLATSKSVLFRSVDLRSL